MYRLLRKRFSVRSATVLLGLWYTALLMLVLFSLLEPEGEFRYVRL